MDDIDIDFDEIDYFRTETFVDDPYPYYDHLRSQCPVQREPHHDVVMVTGYDETVAILADPKTFSSCTTSSGPFPGFPVPLEGDDVSDIVEQYRDELPLSKELVSLDAPEHTAHRALVMRLFTAKRLAATETYMRTLADRLIDDFVARGQCEFVSEFSEPFTLLVIAELLGVPESDRQMFCDEMLGRSGALGSTSAPMVSNPFAFLHERFTHYIEARRATPAHDVMTDLATTPFPDGSLPEVIDVVRLASILFVAGQETTSRLLAAALQLLGDRPELQQLLRDKPERIPNFIEETLRMESPIKGMFRLPRVTKAVSDTEISAGSHAMLVLSGANRDPREFECPNEFRVDRENARHHLAFGRGVHLCAGAALARAEGCIGIERLLDRLPDIRISEAEHGPADARRYEYPPSFQMRGLRQLHLEFDPSDPALRSS